VTQVKCCQNAQYEKIGMQGQDTEVTGRKKTEEAMQAIRGG
jgi:hypothetical protein